MLFWGLFPDAMKVGVRRWRDDERLRDEMEINLDERRFRDERSKLTLKELGVAPLLSGRALSNESGSRREEALATIRTARSVFILVMLKMIELLSVSFLSPQIP